MSHAYSWNAESVGARFAVAARVRRGLCEGRVLLRDVPLVLLIHARSLARQLLEMEYIGTATQLMCTNECR